MRSLWTSCLLSLALAGSVSAESESSLMVVPSRVVMEGTQRSASITLWNRSAHAATFTVSFLHFDMDERGRLSEVPAGDGMKVEEMLLVAPASVRLEPGEGQVFRMLLHKPAQLPAGEYRVHLAFRALPEAAAISSEPQTPGVELQTLMGLSVPLIIRHHTTGSRVAIQDLHYGDGPSAMLTLKLHREGDQSVYGNLHLSWVDEMGVQQSLATLRGIAVYPSQEHRLVELSLPAGSINGPGKLRAVFEALDQEASAETELRLPGI